MIEIIEGKPEDAAAIVEFTKKVGGGSAKYFGKLMKSVAEEEGYVQEKMNGQKVVKVFQLFVAWTFMHTIKRRHLS